LFRRFEQAGDTADLDAAIGAGQQAVGATEPGHPNLAIYLSSLGNALLRRFEQAGDVADLEVAIGAMRQAVTATQAGHSNLAMYLSNLTHALVTRFDQAGAAADLDDAIAAGRQAVAACPPSQPYLAVMQSNLGNALFRRSERTGDAADLDAAIAAGRQAVTATPSGHPNLARYQSNLGGYLRTRFERAGAAADLDDAIAAGQQAVAATPSGHPELPAYLSNLGVAQRRRFGRLGAAADLDDAIAAGQQAVAATPSGHPQRSTYLSSLGISLRTRFELVGDAADLSDAIGAAQRAVAASPPRHAQLPGMLSSLGAALFRRFEQAGDTTDLDGAIGAWQQAVAATPSGHPELSAYLLNLGNARYAWFERTGDAADLDAAISCWQHASRMPTGTSGVRLTAARSWGAAAADAGRTDQAADAYAAAVGLLPAVAWHGLDRATREEQLAQWAGLAADAAACAVLDARPELAVELVEQGRSVLWSQALNLRTDLTRLAEKTPDLAERLDNIRAILDSPVPEATPPLSQPAAGSAPSGAFARQHDVIELRRRKAREWDDMLAQVRALPGFEHFLAATPYPELATAARDGPVVIVNASRYGCHALIVDSGSEHAHVINLPAMSLDAAVDHTKRMLRALKGAGQMQGFLDREKDRQAILDVLDWLWDVLAEPVLTALRHTSTPETGSPWPRVWWCPTGPLTVLPIHAAGRHPRLRTGTTVSTGGVLDWVISSYTPTLTALTLTRLSAEPSSVRQLTIGMPSTPSLPPLPAVRAELTVLARHFPLGADNHQLTGSHATRSDVLAAMATHSWVHLACHASQRHADPARSGFALWDGTLTITDLAGQATQHRDLAFLSACQTAAGSIRHLDEAIHLAAAMQFIGYRHIIATMWVIDDPSAPDIADSVYTALTRGGRPDPDRTAEALHRAIRTLRETDPTNPLLWAPYIHLGS
jgi:tetratricopeptide (TPR) repeat protein